MLESRTVRGGPGVEWRPEQSWEDSPQAGKSGGFSDGLLGKRKAAKGRQNKPRYGDRIQPARGWDKRCRAK